MDRQTMAVEAAHAGAELAAELFRTSLDVETKASATDYVTEADTGSQRRIVERIADAYPDDAIVGEEGDQRKRLRDGETAWVIDPIDGTTNYVRGIPFWATSVAAVVDGETVAAANSLPALDEVYHAGTDGVTHDGDAATVSDTADLETSVVAPTLRYGREHGDAYGSLLGTLSPAVGDVRRLGSAQTALSLVAGGHVDAALGVVASHPWDTVAGVHLIRQAGGRVTDLTGEPWTPRSEGLVASNGRIHDDLLALLS
ncbi:inositol monophosphatase family protein [Haloplanus aerogenes]|uniref:fructose-bisphosphatase n=1 Tax=Haloplanus aerogenes TaxID=660522 RepID=A0A3M0DT85_9EURY|nr:inositol monophosphatase [Haloplanus aerogenes]AZH25480.1 inositol monophosphatase [Haloplanus aerogenes]RMB25192.1 myo-inositol-1(or 4)-monophosphatase [Haloplanus aerogenes]